MPAKAVYKSIHDENNGRKGIGTRIKMRLRLKSLFGKKNIINPDEKKRVNDENRSIADKTVCESPIKEEESDDSYSEQFDVYFASSFLPHVNIAEKDAADRGLEKKSMHWKAFVDAKEMSTPPPPPQKARARLETLRDPYPMKDEHESKVEPTNLTNAFENEVEITTPMLAKEPKDLIITIVESPPTTAEAYKPKENLSNALNIAKELFTFDGDLINTVDKSQADFNQMLDRMSSETVSIQLTNPCSDETILSSYLKSEMNGTVETEGGTTESETTAPKTINGIVKYFSQLQAAAGETSDTSLSCEDTYGTAGSTVYQELLKSKMDSIAKAFSSVAAETTQRTSELPSCQAHVCSFMECADALSNVALNKPADASYSPSDHSWYSVYEDSDSVSKLSLPTEANDLSLSMISEATPTLLSVKEKMARTAHDDMCF